jgi:hypothetical protein
MQVILACKDTTSNIRWGLAYSFSGGKGWEVRGQFSVRFIAAAAKSYMSISECLKGGMIFNFLTINDIPMTSRKRGNDCSVTLRCGS